MSTQWKWNSLQHSNFLSFLPINRCRGTHLEWIIFKIVFFSFLFNFFCHSFFFFVYFIPPYLSVYLYFPCLPSHPHPLLFTRIDHCSYTHRMSVFVSVKLSPCIRTPPPKPPICNFVLKWNFPSCPRSHSSNGGHQRCVRAFASRVKNTAWPLSHQSFILSIF